MALLILGSPKDNVLYQKDNVLYITYYTFCFVSMSYAKIATFNLDHLNSAGSGHVYLSPDLSISWWDL